MKVYVVGKYILETGLGAVWEIDGIFEEENVAIENCIDGDYFIGPINLNEPLPKDTIEWPGVYYPSEKGD